MAIILLGCKSPTSDTPPTSTDEPPTGSSTTGTAPTTTNGSITAAASTGEASSTTGAPVDRLELAFEEIPLELPRSEITDLRFFPGSAEFLLLGKPGFVYHYELVGDEAIELGFFTLGHAYILNDCGLLSLAFDPDFADNGLFFVASCLDKDTSGVHRLVWQDGDYEAVADSAALVISEGDTAEYGWHNIGSIGFFPDGSMWIGYGDKTHDEHGQNLSTNLGKMLRIVPDRDGPGGYQPSPRNPFPESPDVWAYGLRVPFRTAIDDRERLIVADVGALDWEELDLVAQPGQNFGWARVEGPCTQDCDGLVDPLVSWPHTTHRYLVEDPDALPTTRWVPWVGPFYDPPADLDRYDGRLSKRLLFGDMCSGWVRALEIDADGEIAYDEHAGHLENATAWTIAPDGFLYAVAGAACVNAEFGDERSRMYRAIPAG